MEMKKWIAAGLTAGMLLTAVPALAEEPRRGELSEKEQMMAQAIRELLTDDALRRRYCESSAACAERFSSEQIIGRWRELIEE